MKYISCKVKFSQSVKYLKEDLFNTSPLAMQYPYNTTPMSILMIRLGYKTSNHFSSLEKNIVQKREEDRKDLKQNPALVFFLSFLLVFLIMLSAFTFIIRLIQCVRRVRKTEYCKQYLAGARVSTVLECGEGSGCGARVWQVEKTRRNKCFNCLNCPLFYITYLHFTMFT